VKSLLTVLLLTSLTSCAWIKAHQAPLSADSLQLVSCVVNSLVAGNAVEDVGCGLQYVEDVVAIADAAKVVPVPSPGLAAVRAKQQSAQPSP
jgi:hypothetical protein